MRRPMWQAHDTAHSRVQSRGHGPSVLTPSAPPPKSVLARNVRWNVASYVLHALALLVLSPFVVRSLGLDLFGVWVIVHSLVGYLNLADLGIRPAIVHFVAKHDAQGDFAGVQRHVSGAFAALSVGGILVVLGCFVLAPHLGAWFDVPAERHGEAAGALLASGILFAIALPLNAFTAVLIGKQRFDLTCRIDLYSLAASTAAIVGVLLLDAGIVALAISIGIVELGEMAWKTRLAFKEEPRLKWAWRGVDRTAVRGLLNYAGLNVIVTASLLLVDKTDALVIGGAISAAAVTLYDRAAKMPIHARTMVFQVGRVLMPELGARDARGDRAGVASLLAKASRNTLLFAGAPIAWLLVLGGPFLETWMLGDASFRLEGASVLVVLALTALFPISSYPLVAAHQGTNRMRSLAVFMALEGATNLALSLWWVREHGVLGVAWGTFVPAALVHGLLLPLWNGRTHGFSGWAWMARVWRIPLPAGLATWGVLHLVYDRNASYGWPALIASTVLAAAVFAGTAYLLAAVGRRKGS